jgi:hypothetical protein
VKRSLEQGSGRPLHCNNGFKPREPPSRPSVPGLASGKTHAALNGQSRQGASYRGRSRPLLWPVKGRSGSGATAWIAFAGTRDGTRVDLVASPTAGSTSFVHGLIARRCMCGSQRPCGGKREGRKDAGAAASMPGRARAPKRGSLGRVAAGLAEQAARRAQALPAKWPDRRRQSPDQTLQRI